MQRDSVYFPKSSILAGVWNSDSVCLPWCRRLPGGRRSSIDNMPAVYRFLGCLALVKYPRFWRVSCLRRASSYKCIHRGLGLFFSSCVSSVIKDGRFTNFRRGFFLSIGRHWIPFKKSLYLDLFSCKKFDSNKIIDYSKEIFKPKKITKKLINR